MSELDNLLPESFFADALAEMGEVEEEEEEVSFKGYMSLEEYIEQNPILGKTIEELKDVFSKNAKEWRKTSWLSAIKRLYVLSEREQTISYIPTDANGEYKIEGLNRFTVPKRVIFGVDRILHHYDRFDCFHHKSFEKSKENFRTFKDPKKLLSAMYSYFCSLDESEFKTKRLPEGHSNVQVVPLPNNIGVEVYLPKKWTSIKSSKKVRSEEYRTLLRRGAIFPKDHAPDHWHRFVFWPSLGIFVGRRVGHHYEIKPEEMAELAKEAVTMPYADYEQTNTWKEITSREDLQIFEEPEYEDEEDEEGESQSQISDIW